MSHFVYALYDKTSGDLLYIGRTMDLDRRFKQHQSTLGTSVRMAVLEGPLPLDAAMRAEKHLIAREVPPRNKGLISSPGLLGHRHSEDTKARISATKQGHSVSPETRAKLSAAQRGRTHTPSAREKISTALQARTRSRETYDKVSAALKGKPLSEEHRAKLKEAWVRRRNP